MKVPNGIQEHYLWQMDGRVWIENANAINTNGVIFKHALKMGYVKPIPHNMIVHIANELR